MNQHEKIEPLLAIYNDLEINELQFVNQHLQTCSACTETLNTYQKMDRVLNDHAAAMETIASNLLLLRAPNRSPQIRSFKQRILFGLKNISARFKWAPTTALVRATIVTAILLLLVFVANGGSYVPDFSLSVAAATPTLEINPQSTSTPTSTPTVTSTATQTATPAIASTPLSNLQKRLATRKEPGRAAQSPLLLIRLAIPAAVTVNPIPTPDPHAASAYQTQ